jgi:hypothetical protein
MRVRYNCRNGWLGKVWAALYGILPVPSSLGSAVS